MNVNNFYREALPNGMTLLFDRRKIPVATIFVATKFGSGYEPLEYKGIAHFIEHMLFKGTKRRKAKNITYEIESVGGEINAFTSDQMTAVYTKMPKKHFGRGLSILLDMSYNSVFDQREIEKERKVIFEEIKVRHDNPVQCAFIKTKEVLYLPPFGLPRSGTSDTISNIKKRDLLEYYCYYSPENLIVAFIGDFPFELIKNKIKTNWKKRKQLSPIKPIAQTKNYMELRKDLQQAHVALGFHTPALKDRKRYAAEIFDCILGKGMSSRLFQEIREKRGLAYTAHSYLTQEKDYGFDIIYVGTSKDKIKEVKEIALNQIKSLQKVDFKEMEDAKEMLIGSYTVESERSEEIATNLILNEIATGAEEYYKYPERIAEVKLNEVREIAKIKGYGTVILSPK